MVAAGQNMKRLLMWGRRGPRSIAQAQALSFPGARRCALDTVSETTTDADFDTEGGVFQQAGSFLMVGLIGLSFREALILSHTG